MLLEHTIQPYGSSTIHMYTFMSPVITNEGLLTRKVNKLTIRISTTSTAEELGLDEYSVGNFTRTEAEIKNVTGTTIQPPTATSGTLSENQLTVLTNLRQNFLRLDKELYYKNVEDNSSTPNK